jgi:hypothetical protein
MSMVMHSSLEVVLMLLRNISQQFSYSGYSNRADKFGRYSTEKRGCLQHQFN